MRFLAIILPVLFLVPTETFAQSLKAGARVTVTSAWHEANGGPYSPQIVKCNAKSEMCLKDTRAEPPVRALIVTSKGVEAGFPEYGITYVFQSGGTGTFLDSNGKQSGEFNWSQ